MRGRPDDYTEQTTEDYPDTVLSGGDSSGNTLPAGDLNDWGSWFQKVGTAVVNTGLDTYKYGQLSKYGGVPAVSRGGAVYTEGQRAPGVAYGNGQAAAAGFGVSPVILIAAAVAVAALLLLRK